MSLKTHRSNYSTAIFVVLAIWLVPSLRCQTSVFCSVTANCTYTGNQTFQGTVAFSGAVTFTNTVTIGSGGLLDFADGGVINASTLLGNTWSAPGAIGSTTPSTGAFTTLLANTSLSINGGTALSTSNQSGTGSLCMTVNCVMTTPNLGTPSSITLTNGTGLPFSGLTTGTLAAGTLTVGSGGALTFSGTGSVNSSTLLGETWAAPGSIGSTTAGSGNFTTLSTSSVGATGDIGGYIFDHGGQVFNVKAYGASCNGSTDDSTALQAAVNAADSAGGIVYTPPGICAHASTITITNADTSLMGAGKQASLWNYTGSSGDGVYYDPPFDISRHGFIEHMAFTCNSSSLAEPTQPALGSTTVGLHLEAMTSRQYDDFAVGGCNTGVLMENVSSSTWTEETNLRGSFINNNYDLELLSDGGGAYSFGYSNLDLYCQDNNNGAGGACLYVRGWLYNSKVSIRANFDNNVVEAENYARVGNVSGSMPDQAAVIDIQGENDTSEAPRFCFSSAYGSLVPDLVIKCNMGSGYAYLSGTQSAWAASTAYSSGALVKSSCANGDIFEAMNSGTSNTSAPTWPCSPTSGGATSLDSRVTDNNITWSNIGVAPGTLGDYTDPVRTINFGDTFGTTAGGEERGIIIQSTQPGPNTGNCWAGDEWLNPSGGADSMLYICQSGSWVNIK